MRQILHIFKKDVRRHWPEILVAFALLGLFLKVTILSPERRMIGASFPWLWLTAESIPPLMIGFWLFLTARLVQSENLVGDRQWWVTKPYEWWKLLASKGLFLLVLIALPLCFVQLYLLHHSGFPAVSNLAGVLKLQYELGVLSLGGIALGCLTRNLWQALLAVVSLFIGLTAVTSLLENIPGYSMSSVVDGSSEAAGLLASVSLIGAVGWQYARRRTWASRGLLLGGLLLNSLIVPALRPYGKLVERGYPLVGPGAAPAHFAPGTIHPPKKKPKSPLSNSRDVYLGIPLSVSSIAPGHMVRLDGVRAHVETPGALKWDPGWRGQGTELWPGDQQTGVILAAKRKDFEGIKGQPVRLQLELALTEFQEAEARDVVLRDGEFSDQLIGFCHLDERNPSSIECRKPFEIPGLMATFDPFPAKCEVPEDERQLFEDRISHAWIGEHRSSGVLNPVDNYQIYFGTGGWVWNSYESSPRIAKRVYLCPGAKLRLAKPEEKGHTRIKLEMNPVHLEDFTSSQFDWDH